MYKALITKIQRAKGVKKRERERSLLGGRNRGPAWKMWHLN